MELISLYSKKIICSQLLIREPSLQVPVKAVKKKNIYYFGPNETYSNTSWQLSLEINKINALLLLLHFLLVLSNNDLSCLEKYWSYLRKIGQT